MHFFHEIPDRQNKCRGHEYNMPVPTVT
jgi:hypothetical protein